MPHQAVLSLRWHTTLRQIVERAGDKWAVLVIGTLENGPLCQKAVAAAALVAAQCPEGEPVDPVYGQEEPLPDLTGLRDLALQALDRVMTEPSS